MCCKGVDLRIGAGERVALMGRNGAGKSTLLRTVAGLVEPVRGRSRRRTGIALLTQNPGDYLVRERVGDELPGEAGLAALRVVGLEHAVDADPRDLSGGERQRLALAIALAGRMDGGGAAGAGRPRRADPGHGPGPQGRPRRPDRRGSPTRGAGVVVATHDVEFAAAFAERVVLLGDGVAIADGGAGEVLSGGWYFATEVARVLDLPGRRHPRAGRRALLAGRRAMSWELASFLILGAVLLAGFAWYERSRPPSQVVALVAALAALAIAGRIAFAAFPNVKPTTDIVDLRRLRARRRAGIRGRRPHRARLQLLVRAGPVDALADGGLGALRHARRGRWRSAARNVGRLSLAAACGLAGIAYGALLNFSLMATYGGELSLRALPARSRRARSRSTSPTRSATSSSR